MKHHVSCGRLHFALAVVVATSVGSLAPRTAWAWEPTKPIEFVIPAGTGGGADQMARLIAGIAEKHDLSPQPIAAINKSGGAGAEGFLYVKGKKGDSHTIVITLSNLFTTPLHTGVPFHWSQRVLESLCSQRHSKAMASWPPATRSNCPRAISRSAGCVSSNTERALSSSAV